ncbi:MAG: bifunctional nuclease family protein [Saprospiraceae bacterium]|nr:bifunctional nuclease family protein [Saprospiraceae bacterium]
MTKIELDIVAISHSVSQSHNYAVVLSEISGNRRLPIVIGGFEAQAIAVAMERMAPNRPLTHDLFKNTLETFDVTLREVIISNLLDGIFYARLICERNGEIYEIDSRTSDAIALAVRFNCPIYTYEFIMESAGVVLENEKEEGQVKSEPRMKKDINSFSRYSLDDLNEMLTEVLADEDYEKAAKIRDEINRRRVEGD